MDAKTTIIVTRRSLENAASVVAVLGGSINGALHLPANAVETGITFKPFDAAKIFKKTPYAAGLKPRGRDIAKDISDVGGMPLPMKKVPLDRGHSHGDGFLEIDADAGSLNGKLTGTELAERKTKWRLRATNHRSGAPWKYARQVGPAVDGAVTHSGGAHEKQCYADI